MLSTKIRTVLAGSIAAAALAAPQVASAATPVHRVGSVPIVTVAPTKAVSAMKEAGSAGVPGYDDSACEGLLHDYNTAVNYLEGSLLAGDSKGAATYGNLAKNIYSQLTSNCLVVD
jgi:hypothetical protein